MTPKQKQQFNKMLLALRTINQYSTIRQLQKDSGTDYGLEYEEALEMAYENIKTEAQFAIKGIKPIE